VSRRIPLGHPLPHPATAVPAAQLARHRPLPDTRRCYQETVRRQRTTRRGSRGNRTPDARLTIAGHILRCKSESNRTPPAARTGTTGPRADSAEQRAGFQRQAAASSKKQTERADLERRRRTLFWTPNQTSVARMGGFHMCGGGLVEPGLIVLRSWRWCAGTLLLFPLATKDVGSATPAIRTAPPAALRCAAFVRSAACVRHDSLDSAKAIPAAPSPAAQGSDTRTIAAVRSSEKTSAVAFDGSRCSDAFPTHVCCFTKYESRFAGGKRPQRQSNCPVWRATFTLAELSIWFVTLQREPYLTERGR
jgi:hypothetical protein